MSDKHTYMHANTHMHTDIGRIHGNCRVRGRDEKREDGVLWLSAHGSRKILAWKDMRIQNVDDYPCPRFRKVCLCVHICASA